MERMFTSVIRPPNFGVCAVGDVAFLSGGHHEGLRHVWFDGRPYAGLTCREIWHALHLVWAFEVCPFDGEGVCILRHIWVNH